MKLQKETFLMSGCFTKCQSLFSFKGLGCPLVENTSQNSGQAFVLCFCHWEPQTLSSEKRGPSISPLPAVEWMSRATCPPGPRGDPHNGGRRDPPPPRGCLPGSGALPTLLQCSEFAVCPQKPIHTNVQTQSSVGQGGHAGLLSLKGQQPELHTLQCFCPKGTGGLV